MPNLSFLIEIKVEIENNHEKYIPTGKVGLISPKEIEKIYGNIGFQVPVYYVEEGFFNFNLITNTNN